MNLSVASQLNNPQISAVLFDLDGTLVDTAPDLAAALNRLRIEEALAPLSYELIRAQVSNGGNALIELGFGVKVGEAGQAELRQRLLDFYQLNIAEHSQVFSGLEVLLEEFKRNFIPWGIVTNKPRVYTELVVAALQLEAQAVVCPEDLGVSKPNPEPLLLAAHQLATPARECLYIGDHPRDIEAGLNAGMHTLAVGFGYLTPESDIHSWGAHKVAADVAEHNQLVRELLGYN